MPSARQVLLNPGQESLDIHRLCEVQSCFALSVAVGNRLITVSFVELAVTEFQCLGVRSIVETHYDFT